MSRLLTHIKTLLSFYFFYCAVCIPFPFYILSFQKDISQFLFGNIVDVVIVNILGETPLNQEITSDSLAMYILLIVLLLLSIISFGIVRFIDNWNNYKHKFYLFINVLLSYYLSLQLLKYGCHKLFKAQFYLPEPNILYTPLGQVSKDLLYWSSMGTSHSYNVFMGMLEVIPALLLLHKKTRLLGVLIAIPVLLNIVAINFSFDISVKVFSMFLLGIALFLIAPYLKVLYDFFIHHKKTEISFRRDLIEKNKSIKIALKVFAIGVIILESFLPYINTNNFNDDTFKRPYLHGAYEVQEAIPIEENDTLNNFNIKRVFIHRNGYIIFQNQNDNMQDFGLEVNHIKKQLTLTDYQQNQRSIDYAYIEKDSILELQFFQNNKEYLLKTKALDWRKLPALQNDFHWTIESVD